MRRQTKKTLVLAVGIALVIMLIAGCEEEQRISSTKRSRLIAQENMQLKKDLDNRNRKIEKQKELLDECMQEKKVLQKESKRNIQEQVKGVFDAVFEENIKLREENKKLKAQIEKLKKELEELRTKPRLPLPDKPQPL